MARRTVRLLVLSLSLSLALSVGIFAREARACGPNISPETSAASGTPEAEVQEVVERYLLALHTRRVARAVAFWAPDARVVTPLTGHGCSPGSMHALSREVWVQRRIDDVARRRYEPQTIGLPVARPDGTIEVTVTAQSQEAPLVETLALRPIDGQWRIVSLVSNRP